MSLDTWDSMLKSLSEPDQDRLQTYPGLLADRNAPAPAVEDLLIR